MRFILLCFFAFLVGCSNNLTNHETKISYTKTSPQGEKILRMGEKMALIDKEIIRGGCWNYIDTLYNRSGFTRKKRRYIFKTAKNSPPYAPLDKIMPGDWLYFINYSYKKVEHSGVFVRWQDRKNAKALILSYGGENRKKPGRYLTYNIKDTFVIIRAKSY